MAGVQPRNPPNFPPAGGCPYGPAAMRARSRMQIRLARYLATAASRSVVDAADPTSGGAFRSWFDVHERHLIVFGVPRSDVAYQAIAGIERLARFVEKSASDAHGANAGGRA